jgi:Ser-tRNA(Ala) deacylase AlaX
VRALERDTAANGYRQADGGTHVAGTGEIGRVRVVNT